MTIDDKEYLRLGLLLEQLFSREPYDHNQDGEPERQPGRGLARRTFGRSDGDVLFVMLGAAAPTADVESRLGIERTCQPPTERRSIMARYEAMRLTRRFAYSGSAVGTSSSRYRLRIQEAQSASPSASPALGW